MKHLLRSILAVALALNFGYAQKKLSSSQQSGSYTFIYKLTDQEAFNVAYRTKSVINDSFFHTLVDSFYNAGNKPYARKLPFGNYLYVRAVKNELQYRLNPENNVNLQFINNRKDFQFTVTDLKGKPVTDAVVKAGKHKTIRYDKQAGLYSAGSAAKHPIITVKYQGLSNYFTYEEEEKHRPYRTGFFKKLFKPKRYGSSYSKAKKPKYTGYMVFNKPMYKPLDTVKFKAYLLDNKGGAIHNKALRVALYKDYKGEGTLLTTLNPYRDGGYVYSFVLADSLQLTLDKNYRIVLKEQHGKEWKEIYQGNFRYEDYELKSVNFTVRSDKEIHSPGSPVSLFLKASDENELAVPDGRVEVVLNTSNASDFYGQKVFVKDTLWKTNLVLDPMGETKLVIPDSIFPKADLNFTAYFTFLNSNNERRTASKSLKYQVKDRSIRHVFKKDSLYLDYVVKGKSTPRKALITMDYPYGGDTDTLQVMFPAAIKMNYRGSDYEISMADGYRETIYLEDLKPAISVTAVQSKDSLRVQVSNEHKVPFWYSIFSDHRVSLKGYATRLDTIIKHSSAKAVHVKLNYIWDEEEQSTETSAFYRPNILNVRLLAPEVVYPGQTVNMQVKVTDVNNIPVAATDVTAYAYTSRFKNGYGANLPYFGKRFFARKLNREFEAEDLSTSGALRLNWEKWSRELKLDTIAYYKFSQTRDLYVIKEQGKDTSSAVFAPFVVKDGAIEPVHILYIDDQPVYFSQADQLQRYAFAVRPGRHDIRMRTTGYTVHLDDFELPKGKKTILSVAADVHNSKADVSISPHVMTNDEAMLLNKYMLRITDNFKGEKTTLTAGSTEHLLNFQDTTAAVAAQQRLMEYYAKPANNSSGLLAGPFSENLLEFKSGALRQNFIKEPGYTYTFLPGLLKQKSYPGYYAFKTSLNAAAGATDYKQYPLKKGETDSIWNAYLDLRSRTTALFNNGYGGRKNFGRLVMKLDTSMSNQLPYLKNIIIYKYDEPDFLQVYPGNTSQFNALEQGRYRIIYLFKDNRYFVAEQVEIKTGGINSFEWKGMKILGSDQLSKKLDQQVKSVNIGRNSSNPANVQQEILEGLNERYFDKAILTGKMSGRVIDAGSKQAIPAAVVKIKGASYSTLTDAEGRFSIKVPKRGKLLVSSIGYETREISAADAYIGDIPLDAASSALEEVVVVGYGTQKKQNLTGAIYALREDITGSLAGRVAGVAVSGGQRELMIRGTNSMSAAQKPLILVDGLPFDGDVSSLDPADIEAMNVLKDASATAIYGARAANGVIIIKTKAGLARANPAGALVQQEQTMRRNFSDYAIWQPQLFTGADGTAAFSVKFPDDITSWTTKLLAINGRKQGGVAETSIRSFKVLSANFVSPAFALQGDSIRVIGKLMNYSNTAETVNRKLSYNGNELLNSKVNFKNAKIDTVAIVAMGAGLKVHPDQLNVLDSLNFEYTMKQDNGYFDGEIRKIPLFQTGVTETKGFFHALSRDTSITYTFDPALGKVTLRAEASLFPTLLDELEKLRKYEYLCNEQLASKLKALLLEKSVRKYLGEEFKEEKNIRYLLKKLQDNKRPEGTWGWWQNSSEELWISLHVVESLLDAQQQGYAVVLDKNKLYRYLLDKMAGSADFDQIYGIKLLHLLNEKHYLNDWITAIEKNRALEEARNARERKANSSIPALPEQPLFEKLQLMQLKQQAGMAVDVKWLLSKKNETMFGNSYWGTEGRHFWDNSIQNTLLAYQILKTNGQYKDELDRIQRYFLEQRRDGQWRNTYESSLILETILPGLMVAPGKKPAPASLSLNQAESITVFPFNRTLAPEKLTISKKGDAPVYFTAFQQFNNPKPEKVSKDFTVKSWFDQQGTEVKQLKAGTLANLQVEVEVRADADYVMIEIPIPAGCSYEQKLQSFWGVETHREYFKHKTAIFCTKLKKGKYRFSVQLMPRYSGNYSLNPAKAEMMYFPVFFGREGMKGIKVL
ncbi:carboxypeptidase regulatory-like domain-containing protein [Pedobacter heparinus]|uniref:alpha-2-macroglobulin family protein n=1 Tax=Pedobacter heparinus TaxID=984 RepID=UPI0029318AB2|nr:alpha-2-macroglobulin family protein [Pedobacter heparinus]